MITNIGNADRAIRVVLGLALIAFAWFYASTPYAWLGWIGVIPILTAIAGTCPVYSLLGVSTCPTSLPRNR